ncbi:hypothetical protein F4775DRAFT_587404 [Biscogniauxia sp. FL1348]|nr:hypothetical protein F4775DRAFT_587404 [Biscogniauxia sp. FL1348]
MAPIPVYTDSPISAAKPSGVTPKTDAPAEQPPSTAPRPTAASPTAPTQASYPQARPGAAPSLPTPTPTYTATAADPAPPQPGPVPVSVPPPPRVGEKYQHPQPTPAPQMPYPHQMSIPPPAASYPSQQHGTSTATAPPSLYGKQPSAGPGAGGGQDAQGHEHPPGYQQNANASELDSYQRSAIRQSELEARTTDDSEGIWGAAKKLAQQTGEKLVAAENEVWKKINKE